MGMFDQPEEFFRADTPLKLFMADGKTVLARLMPASLAEQWSNAAREVEMLDDKAARLARITQKAVDLRDIADIDGLDLNEAAQKKVLEFKEKLEKAQDERFTRMKALLVEYDHTVFTPEVMESATILQLTGAFQQLKAYNDPFIAGSVLQLKAAEELTGQRTAKAAAMVAGTNSAEKR